MGPVSPRLSCQGSTWVSEEAAGSRQQTPGLLNKRYPLGLFFFFNLFYLFIIFGCIGSSLLLYVALHGLLTAVPSLVVEHGLQAHGLQ